MAIVQTGLANSIDASSGRSRLDAVAKKLIRHKIILAEILKECVDEFRDYDVGFIEKHCIVGDIKMDEVSVDQDVPDADGRVVGADTGVYEVGLWKNPQGLLYLDLPRPEKREHKFHCRIRVRAAEGYWTGQ